MITLSDKLKQVLSRHLENASPREILAIVGSLCEPDDEPAPAKGAGFVKINRHGYHQSVDCSDWVAVEDLATGLIWTRDDACEDRHDWKGAQKAASAIKLCGQTDWRLPTIKELLSLVDYNKHSPAIDKAFFPNCKAEWYWTSTPYASSPGDCAWVVHFGYGYSNVFDQDGEGLVRAVRARQ